ncbi:hypothetical protein C8J56DRAFT_968200 [Mycena floridula]|nr:hypothetical protein C8J56DRAFT_968200 [Mycena floridula]
MRFSPLFLVLCIYHIHQTWAAGSSKSATKRSSSSRNRSPSPGVDLYLDVEKGKMMRFTRCPGPEELRYFRSKRFGRLAPGSVFYSYPGTDDHARKFAVALKGHTIYNCITQEEIEALQTLCPNHKNLWTDMSTAYAMATRGDTYVVMGDKRNAHGAWVKNELPELYKNRRSHKIRLFRVDPVTKQKTLWFTPDTKGDRPPPIPKSVSSHSSSSSSSRSRTTSGRGQSSPTPTATCGKPCQVWLGPFVWAQDATWEAQTMISSIHQIAWDYVKPGTGFHAECCSDPSFAVLHFHNAESANWFVGSWPSRYGRGTQYLDVEAHAVT